MAKFVIECPSCGKYTEAKKGLFGTTFLGTKKIDCFCGYTIDVKTDKITCKQCPHCGNDVIFDQSKSDEATCPVCHQHINTQQSREKLVEFRCPTCSCKLSADKAATTYDCPLCDTKIDVQLQVKKEEVKKQGLVSLIKYEGANDIFVWKHPIEDFNLGSQLIVHESQEAIFFRDGRALDLFGAGRYTLATQNIPVLEELYKLSDDSNAVFHSEVYFVNMTTQMGIKWGTDSKVRLFDPGSGLHIEIGACGNFNLRVSDSRKLLVKLVGTTSELSQGQILGDGFGTATAVGKFKALVMNKVKSNLARTIKENNINILEIDSQIDILSEKMRDTINEILMEYGLFMPEFFITSVITPDDDPNFKRLKQQFAEKTLRVREEEVRKAEAEAAQSRKLVEAQTEAQLKMVSAQGEAEALKLKAMAEAEAYRAQAMAEADEMRAKGYTYQQETARMVGMEAMQNGIGFGGAGSPSTGNSSNGGFMGGSAIGDLANLGMTLGAMGGVMNMTKDALNPIMQTAKDIGSGISGAAAGTITAANDSWNCSCGAMGITTKCCPECGSKKPELTKKDSWTCTACGVSGITSKFCPECGAKKPEPPATWNCPACGFKDITSKFCPDCGAKKPEAPAAWDCICGATGITSKFCPECGKGKE